MNQSINKIRSTILKEKYLPVIIGPTATGKTGLSIELAKKLNGEIISLDSMQIYKGMDIGTAKVTEQEKQGIPHHLLDMISLTKIFSAGEFADMAKEKIREIWQSGNIPMVVGGTGLYLKALLHGLYSSPARSEALRGYLQKWEKRQGLKSLHRYLSQVDKKSAGMINHNDRQRIYRSLEIFLVTGYPPSFHKKRDGFGEEEFKTIKIGLEYPDRAELYKIINERVDHMFELGWLDEVKRLLSKYPADLHPFKAIGYREIVKLLSGEIGLEECKEEIKKQTRNFAKRQLTWFRKVDNIHWFDISAGKELVCESVLQYIDDYYIAGSNLDGIRTE